MQEECVKMVAKSGSRNTVMKRLNKPLPPVLWLKRKAKVKYVPARHDTGGCALLVSLLTLHEQNPTSVDFPKEEIYTRAEALQITKKPFSGGTTQTGPYHYDGLSNMVYLLQGNPPLVAKYKKYCFRLTTRCEITGLAVAKQMHA